MQGDRLYPKVSTAIFNLKATQHTYICNANSSIIATLLIGYQGTGIKSFLHGDKSSSRPIDKQYAVQRVDTK
jgi:hypothetical protein